MNFRFVLIGSGNIAGSYRRAVGNVAGAEIVGLVSRSRRRPAWLPETVPSVASLEEIDIPFDAVIVATPNGTHGEWIARAARLGKHVLCEKALEINAARARAAVEICRTHHVRLGVAYQHRFRTDNLICYQMLQQGAFGRIFCAELRVPYFRDQAYYDSAPYRGTVAGDGGGPFLQQAVHQIDLYGWFFGLPAEAKTMLAHFSHRMEAEDFGAALLRHRDGMVGTILATTCFRPGFRAELTIHTGRGSLRMVNDQIVEWGVDGIAQPGAKYAAPEMRSGAGSAVVEDTIDHERLIEDFIDAAVCGRDPAVNGEAGLLTAQLTDMLYDGAGDQANRRIPAIS